MLVSVWVRLRFLFLLSRAEVEAARDEKSIGKKTGLAIMLVRATIASPPDHEEASSWWL
jgi:hypothetical protein